jgi:hypothetical protein
MPLNSYTINKTDLKFIAFFRDFHRFFAKTALFRPKMPQNVRLSLLASFRHIFAIPV